ncbi:MAG: SDR family oxidoreductase [Rhodospirillales bacterium]|nr:SDR family oxidoreductase [Rhodospirillales bacterium]MDH3791758.1 SDR family oxidoreductase [Rhodospirillales bacterium]MDH3914058.1 SDR family oxidoreductase [Rhodospirillales bacterium]MDH3919464.1 SDR family oxidoreductase [Rhodospirillales bacterium]MDH3969425.1 SDR family oxidoreductase [Rhodospirillales bacterium]
MPSALITGANRGIGLAFARSFAADGWQVYGCCRQPDKARELKDLAGEVTVHRLDVTDGLQVAGLARELAGQPVDILLNNAGIYGSRAGFGETDFEVWPQVFQVNVMAPLRLAERFVEQVAQSDRKLIVNISSRMGSIAENSSGGGYVYRSSKAALNMVARSLSIDLAGRGITVVMFHPGWVQTDMGGANAAVTAGESVAGMRAVIERLTPADNGRFFTHDGGEIQW